MSPTGVCEECGNDEPAEGHRFCLDCLIDLDCELEDEEVNP